MRSPPPYLIAVSYQGALLVSGIKPYGKIVTDSKLFLTAHVGGDQRRVTVRETTYTSPPNAGSVLSDWQHLVARAVYRIFLISATRASLVTNGCPLPRTFL